MKIENLYFFVLLYTKYVPCIDHSNLPVDKNDQLIYSQKSIYHPNETNEENHFSMRHGQVLRIV